MDSGNNFLSVGNEINDFFFFQSGINYCIYIVFYHLQSVSMHDLT